MPTFHTHLKDETWDKNDENISLSLIGLNILKVLLVLIWQPGIMKFATIIGTLPAAVYGVLLIRSEFCSIIITIKKKKKIINGI